MSKSKIFLALAVFIQTSTVIYWFIDAFMNEGIFVFRQKSTSELLRGNLLVLSGLFLSLLLLLIALALYIEKRIK